MTMTGPNTDVQKESVYTAENLLMYLMPEYSEQMSLAEIVAFVDRVTATQWFCQRFWPPDWAFNVRDGRGYHRALGWWDHDRRIAHLSFPRNLRQRLIVLHEIAHCFPPSGSSHGRVFCAAYLALVKRFLGREPWEELRESFDAFGVKYRARSSPETVLSMRALEMCSSIGFRSAFA